MRLAGALLIASLVACAYVHAQTPAAVPAPAAPSAHPATADDICRTIEQDAAANGVPVEFLARVIWRESRFNASACEPQGRGGDRAIHAGDGR